MDNAFVDDNDHQVNHSTPGGADNNKKTLLYQPNIKLGQEMLWIGEL